MLKPGNDATQFCQPLEPPDGGIAGLRLAVQIVEDVLPMIRPERN
jgi:hypothetical protein